MQKKLLDKITNSVFEKHFHQLKGLWKVYFPVKQNTTIKKTVTGAYLRH